jgi:UDP-N-acetylglucosamine--N-acetylmuramyl-(pentapeptide) pyrophosphoryl-undecaprenol N-acetylglucosamine transferase
LFDSTSSIDKLSLVSAGKFRRYFDDNLFKKLTDLPTILLNVRDIFLIIIGVFQSIFILILKRPNVAFIKGGYVGVPVGLACRILRVPYVTHDSDATSGLTNKLIGPGAKVNALGLPSKSHKYSVKKSVNVGVPINPEYSVNGQSKIQKYRNDLKIRPNDKLLLILGGSLGAQRIDKIFLKISESLLTKKQNLVIIHQVGKGNENLYKTYPGEILKRISVKRFLNPIAPYYFAADLVVTRAGATAIAELAAIKKPVIAIPATQLTGGHQLDNAKLLENAKAAIIFNENSNPNELEKIIIEALSDAKKLDSLAINLHELLPGDATEKISELLQRIAGND